MANYTKLTDLFTAIANAIRGKTGETETIPANQFAEKIAMIETGVDTSDATASSSDILSEKTAYVNGEKVTGTIPTKTASDLLSSGATVTVPAGYYASQASKSVATATQATPSISVNSSGVITASATQSAGYVSSGTKSATKQLTTQGAQTITPGTSNKTISSGRYLTGTQTIKGDSNLVAGNIKSGVSIFGVSGSLTSYKVNTSLWSVTDQDGNYYTTLVLPISNTIKYAMGYTYDDENKTNTIFTCINGAWTYIKGSYSLACTQNGDKVTASSGTFKMIGPGQNPFKRCILVY